MSKSRWVQFWIDGVGGVLRAIDTAGVPWSVILQPRMGKTTFFRFNFDGFHDFGSCAAISRKIVLSELMSYWWKYGANPSLHRWPRNPESPNPRNPTIAGISKVATDSHFPFTEFKDFWNYKTEAGSKAPKKIEIHEAIIRPFAK